MQKGNTIGVDPTDDDSFTSEVNEVAVDAAENPLGENPLDGLGASESSVAMWERKREAWARFNRMDRIVQNLQAALDKDGTLAPDIVTALSQGVDTAWSRRREESFNMAIVSALCVTIIVPLLMEPPGAEEVDSSNTVHEAMDTACVLALVASLGLFAGNILFTMSYLNAWNKYFTCDADWYEYHMSVNFDATTARYAATGPFTLALCNLLAGLLLRIPFVYIHNETAVVATFFMVAILCLWVFGWTFPVLSSLGLDCSPWGSRAMKRLARDEVTEVAELQALLNLLKLCVSVAEEVGGGA